MQPVLALADEELLIPIIAIVGSFIVGFGWLLFYSVTTILKDRQRGRTAREIAAYVAEGSMTPEEGERLIRAASQAIPTAKNS
jgi:hypothetical protein